MALFLVPAGGRNADHLEETSAGRAGAMMEGVIQQTNGGSNVEEDDVLQRYLRKIPILTSIFFRWVGTTNQKCILGCTICTSLKQTAPEHVSLENFSGYVAVREVYSFNFCFMVRAE